MNKRQAKSARKLANIRLENRARFDPSWRDLGVYLGVEDSDIVRWTRTVDRINAWPLGTGILGLLEYTKEFNDTDNRD